MDALRKAEKAKKQAEKAETSERGQEQGEQQTIAHQQPAPSTPDTAADETSLEPESTPAPGLPEAESSTEPAPAIPDVEIEFQQADGQENKQEDRQDEKPDREQKTDDQARESERDSNEDSEDSTQSVGLSLEPIDSGLSSVTRKDFAADATPDYSLETPKPIVNSDYSSSPATDDETIQESVKDSATHHSAEPRHQKPAEDTVPGTQATETVNVKTDASKPEPVRPVPPTNQVRSKTVPNPSLRTESDLDSISARSEPDRRSARAVFAAKKQGKKTRRFRIRRSTRIWAAQIAAALLLMVGGAYYYFSTSGNGNTFNVPEQYLTNQDSYSNNFNDELEALDQADMVEDAPLESLTGSLDEASPAVDAEILTAEAPNEISPAAEQIAELAAPATTPSVPESVPEEATENAPEAELASSESVDNQTEQVEPAAETTLADVAEQTLPSRDVQTFQPSRPVQPADGSISFSRAQPRSGTDPILQDAYSAYQRDDLSRAQELYQQVLIESPLQRDALLGLAAIATRNNETSLAMELYSRLLARDPSDGVARAGLLGIRPLGGPETQERELRRLQEEHPEVAPVAYALGNFYAVQNRWNEAQRFYFNALQLAKTDALSGVPVNPDYAFNLAVSLERLNQSAAAETYYREAIAFAEDFPAGFDVSVARSRLRSLTGANS